ncbi:hypothetical protein [Piscinibacter koreensis]|uniref:Uncharacterized protein n=1 Tax=Piscinibacter koreensis TaxID=2742824 RepID=A0A7Y6TZF5_9BURK|nr:hypothetical protein [Schlegelella koreensis]NUZ09066.1 hypothetical protein [Schlegelella koreensis]
MRFSSRLAASKGASAVVLEDAPRATRIGYIKGILGEFVGTQGSYRSRSEPLDAQETHEAFSALVRDEADPWDYDNQSAWAALVAHLKECAWPEFYDFVELVGVLLLKKDEDIPFTDPDYFKAYQTKVNALLQEDNIGWSLNKDAQLVRQTPKALSKRVELVGSSLGDRFETARVHYQKALKYLYQHPLDEANSVKEIVSAVESVARILHPKASTLGEAIKLMRKDAKYSTQLLEALEKLYAYSNSTPLVRHGHAKAGKPLLAEAELALFMEVSFIRYLIEVGDGGV